jgi:hypothetical protein
MNINIDVALILWNTDVIELVSLVLLHRNLSSSGLEPSEGAERMEDLIVSCGPRVVVFDLDPPYVRSAGVALRLLDRFPGPSFVMTCADPTLALCNAPWLSGHPMFQKPYEIDVIADTVRSMVRFTPRSMATPSIGAAGEKTPLKIDRMSKKHIGRCMTRP